MSQSAALVPLQPLQSVKESDPSLREVEEGENDYFCVLSVDPPFDYVISGFEVLSVVLRHILIQGTDPAGESKVYDLFIRDDPSLDRAYPVPIEVEDYAYIDVSKT